MAPKADWLPYCLVLATTPSERSQPAIWRVTNRTRPAPASDVGQALVHPDTRQLAVGELGPAQIAQQLAYPAGVDMAEVLVGVAAEAERGPRQVVDVLIVDEHHNSMSRHGNKK